MWKKLRDETLALGFTLAGSVIVIITLSGETQRIAMWLTFFAVAMHYTLVLMKKDDE